MSLLPEALSDTLMRRLPPGDGVDQQHLQQLISALCQALEQGQLGLDLEGDPPDGVDVQAWPSAHLEALAASQWLNTLIVQDGPWLRWRRWQEQLNRCLAALLQRAASPLAQSARSEAPLAGEMEAILSGLDREQQAAVLATQNQQLVLLLGGPGTGKTSTVTAMLRAALTREPQLRLQLAAPTGKAAARLQQALPEQPCATLHRLLEARGGNHFGRNRRKPLDLDLLVVDEVSMVDLPLMAALLEALPDSAQLLLVGDPGQLPPVGTGAVLEELCRPPVRQQLGQAVVELRTTYRNNGAIAAAAQQLRSTETGSNPLEALRPLLEQLEPQANLQWLQAPLQGLPEAVLVPLLKHQQVLEQLSGQVTTTSAAALLEELDALIALSPLRKGPWGVEALHRRLLGAASEAPLEQWPLGTPVLNRQNRPDEGLANGDIGVLVQRDGQRWVLMHGERWLHPARLAGAEPALALTVHKSQGSQYARVLLLVPPSRHSDPRLLYTGLTRARQQALLVTPVEAS